MEKRRGREKTSRPPGDRPQLGLMRPNLNSVVLDKGSSKWKSGDWTRNIAPSHQPKHNLMTHYYTLPQLHPPAKSPTTNTGSAANPLAGPPSASAPDAVAVDELQTCPSRIMPAMCIQLSPLQPEQHGLECGNTAQTSLLLSVVSLPPSLTFLHRAILA
ncbi:unnamed protein product [Pleuronectes platessa]|uniref:Uncharacterized protein n=1 Tax=Pleuronectes platessa TaxID=8262 RepID=A0A9N7U9T3_PLEPL|nr:unnamed protein product [Pleuronectes platessa]